MNWFKKYQALKSLDPIGLEVVTVIDDKDGTVHYRARLGYTEIGGNGVLIGIWEMGKTIQAAVNELWNRVSEIQEPLYLVTRQDGVRRHFRWNKVMWQEIPR